MAEGLPPVRITIECGTGCTLELRTKDPPTANQCP
jgi:hypothetical protein